MTIVRQERSFDGWWNISVNCHFCAKKMVKLSAIMRLPFLHLPWDWSLARKTREKVTNLNYIYNEIMIPFNPISSRFFIGISSLGFVKCILCETRNFGNNSWNLKNYFLIYKLAFIWDKVENLFYLVSRGIRYFVSDWRNDVLKRCYSFFRKLKIPFWSKAQVSTSKN